MSLALKSDNKYLCKDKEKLKAIMREEGFIFKNSTLLRDEYFIDINNKLLSTDTCIRIRIVNNKDVLLSYNGNIENISTIDIKDNQTVNMDISQYENIKSFLADLGYYKYISLDLLKETYVKKEGEYYYSISIDHIENIGEFIDYDIYTENNNGDKLKDVFSKFEIKLKECLSEKIKNKYRDYSSKGIYNNILKGDYLNRILVELDKIIYNINLDDLESSIKNKYTILNLELIEKLEQKNIDISIVYANKDEEIVNSIKKILDKVGYAPKFLNINQIKEIAVRETLIIEKQKKIEFSEVALVILNNRA